MTTWILLVDSSHVILCSLHSEFGRSKQPEKHGMAVPKLLSCDLATPLCVGLL